MNGHVDLNTTFESSAAVWLVTEIESEIVRKFLLRVEDPVEEVRRFLIIYAQ